MFLNTNGVCETPIICRKGLKHMTANIFQDGYTVHDLCRSLQSYEMLSKALQQGNRVIVHRGEREQRSYMVYIGGFNK